MRHPAPIISALSLAAALALTGCADPAPVIPPQPTVPAPQAETMPKPPAGGAQVIYQPGHWDWTGSSYAWTSGAWVLAAGHGGTFQTGSWVLQNNAWVWVGPHWL